MEISGQSGNVDMLQNIILYIKATQRYQLEEFVDRMKKARLVCSVLWKEEDLEECNLKEQDVQSAILITDSQVMAGIWKKRGGVCVACTEEEGFFEGAVMVTDSLNELTGELLEECLLHELGLPVTVAETQRLILREIAREDIDTLCGISRQGGMEYLMDVNLDTSDTKSNTKTDGFFEPERMQAYIKNVYRFYGYGMWSVWTKTGELIGCCGFHERESALDEGEEWKSGHEIADMHLELQYMLDSAYQMQGYGQEMCRAALDYIAARTDWEQVWVRVHAENEASVRLAKRLGFCEKRLCDHNLPQAGRNLEGRHKIRTMYLDMKEYLAKA